MSQFDYDRAAATTPFERIGEYAAILNHLASQSERRQNMNNVFVGLNTVFLTGIGLLLLSSLLKSWWTAIAVAIVSVTVFPLNILWRRLLIVYRRSSDLTFEYLREIEEEIRQRREERNEKANIGLFLRLTDTAGKPSIGRTQLELRLATYFMFLYPTISIVVAAVTYLVVHGYIPPLSTIK